MFVSSNSSINNVSSGFLDSCGGGTFSAVKFDKKTLKSIELFQISNNIKNPVDLKNIHCTIVNSTDKRLSFYPVEEHLNILGKITHFEVWKMDSGDHCLVAMIDSSDLESRHTYISEIYGVNNRYNEYKPHITISKNISKYLNVNNLKNIPENIRIISEYVKDNTIH